LQVGALGAEGDVEPAPRLERDRQAHLDRRDAGRLHSGVQPGHGPGWVGGATVMGRDRHLLDPHVAGAECSLDPPAQEGGGRAADGERRVADGEMHEAGVDGGEDVAARLRRAALERLRDGGGAFGRLEPLRRADRRAAFVGEEPEAGGLRGEERAEDR
jgi:hypothetical protein